MKLTKQHIAALLPKRPVEANKGTFGKVLVVAGSKNYPGAAYLSCAAAYRVGAGLVTLATEPEVKLIVSRKLPEVTFLSRGEVFKKIDNYDVLLIGPGLGHSSQTTKFTREILNQSLPTIVIDGDGLNIISKIGKWWEKLRGDTILTPHPGEMSRLTDLSTAEIQADRTHVAQYFAKKWGKIVILKGANTVTVSPTGKVLLSPFANPVLSTAGTGDILSGIIAGFLAQGLQVFDAAAVGVYIHGLAGKMVSEKIGDAGMLASDLLPILPEVLLHISKHRVS